MIQQLSLGAYQEKSVFTAYIYMYIYIYNRIRIRHELDIYKNINSSIFIISINESNPHFHKRKMDK